MTGRGEIAAAAGVGPYKFLDYFTETEQTRFFGRDRDVDEAVARIARARAFALYGRSGIGKTSLVRAGIVPELERRGFRPVYARILGSPARDLAAQVARALGVEGVRDDEPLRDVLSRAAAAGPVVLVLDQFEESFTRFRRASKARAEIVAALGDAYADAAAGTRFVWSLREDFLAELDELGSAIPDILDNRYRLQALTAFGTREAIARPLIDAGIEYSQRLLDRLVDLLAELGFDPPMLQIICTEVHREAVRRTGGAPPHLEEEDLDRVGGVEGIFRRYLDEVAARVPSNRHLVMRSLLDALITKDRTKRPMTVRALLDDDFVASETELLELLEVLVGQRLARREQRGDEDWYELIHDRLVPVVLSWLDLDRSYFQFRSARQLVASSSRGELWRRDPETLLNEGQLAGVVGPHKERLRLDDVEIEFALTSAVFRASDDVRFWAEAFGRDRSAKLLCGLLASDSARMRAGAARAAGRLDGAGGSLAPACLAAALDDPDEGVRRAAGTSLARLAGAAEIDAIRAALADPLRERAARDVLADLAPLRPLPPEIGWWRRWRARAEAERRLLRRDATRIAARGSRGLYGGVVAGLLWSATLAVPFAAIGEWTMGSGQVLTAHLVVSIGAFVLSSLVGWRAGASCGRVEALLGREDWGRSVVRPAVAVWPAIPLLGSTLFGAAAGMRDAAAIPGPARAPLAFALVALLSGLGIATCFVVVRACQRLSLSGATWPRRVAWALAATIGLPVSVPLLLGAAALLGGAGAKIASNVEIVAASTMFCAGVLSATVLSAVLALANAPDARRGGTDADAGPARSSRTLLLAGVAATAILVAASVDPDAVPAFAPAFVLRSGAPAAVPVEEGWPYRRYARLDVELERQSLALVKASGTGATLAVRGASASDSLVLSPADGPYLFPRGSYDLLVHTVPLPSARQSTTAPPLSENVRLEIVPWPEVVELADDWSLTAAVLTRGAPGRWIGSVAAKRPGAAGAAQEHTSVRVVVLASAALLPGSTRAPRVVALDEPAEPATVADQPEQAAWIERTGAAPPPAAAEQRPANVLRKAADATEIHYQLLSIGAGGMPDEAAVPKLRLRRRLSARPFGPSIPADPGARGARFPIEGDAVRIELEVALDDAGDAEGAGAPDPFGGGDAPGARTRSGGAAPARASHLGADALTLVVALRGSAEVNPNRTRLQSEHANGLPIRDLYDGVPGCYIACYLPDGPKGMIRVEGTYPVETPTNERMNRICAPYRGDDESRDPKKEHAPFCNAFFPACQGACTIGYDTGGFFTAVPQR